MIVDFSEEKRKFSLILRPNGSKRTLEKVLYESRAVPVFRWGERQTNWCTLEHTKLHFQLENVSFDAWMGYS